MTDKQIIIDGVDVSGCELYREDNGVFAPDGTAERTELCYLTNDYCGNNPNCYYKQLKRKEQECEELKEKLIKWLGKEGLRQSEKEFYEQQLDQLKAENDELKDLNTRLDNQRETYWKGYQKLKATLTDIKEIAKQCSGKDFCADCKYCEQCYVEDEKIPTYDVCKLILQKISECEVGNEF